MLKHAQATRIVVEMGVAASRQQVFICVSDNGKGLTASDLDGRGLGNMARRAASFGAELRVDSTGEGTTVQLLLPIA